MWAPHSVDESWVVAGPTVALAPSRTWPWADRLAGRLIASPGAGAGADMAGDGDARWKGRVGDRLLPGGGQGQLAGPQAQRGVAAVAVVGWAGACVGGLRRWSRRRCRRPRRTAGAQQQE